MGWKNHLYQQINSGNNIYLCHGRARAFSKKCYSKLRWPKVWSEDAYSYLENQRLGFKFAFSPKAIIYYQSPHTLNDHLRQSKRFLTNTKILSNYFPLTTLSQNFDIPKKLFFTEIIKGVISHPLYATTYISFFLISLLQTKISSNQTSSNMAMWEPSVSTKTIKI